MGSKDNRVFSSLNIFFRRFQGNPEADSIRSKCLACLSSADVLTKMHAHQTSLVSVYETALDFIAKAAVENCFDKDLLVMQRDLYRELEYILSSGEGTARYNFLVVIPVADRPIMLKNCLKSLIEQCRIFQYGGLSVNLQGRPVYNKISVLIVDDSKDEDNMRRIEGICAENTAAGIRTFYAGRDEQTELLGQIHESSRTKLRSLIGETGGPGEANKGASISRNLAYLYLNTFLGDSGERTLIYFLDSDEEFRIKHKGNSGIEEIPFINYFFWLDKIFTSGDIEILTGKVVGDPPVSPAVMINTFIEDITLFLETALTAAPEGQCVFHDDRAATGSSAEYHDMVNLFGYNGTSHPREYHCSLSGTHSTLDCLEDFSKKTLGFFYGLHPTRTQFYRHSGGFAATESARTVYTGNYVFRKTGLRHFIPFADLKLRMAGPALGRILRKRLGHRFVSANLPLLHKRTLHSNYRNEYRSGITVENNSIDLSLEFNRQFWGDVLLFSIEALTELGYPEKQLGTDDITQITLSVEAKLWKLYNEKQIEIEDKACIIGNILSQEKSWWNHIPEAGRAVENITTFCSLVQSNFGSHSKGMNEISVQIREGAFINTIINAIRSFHETDIAWEELLQSDLKVSSNAGNVCIHNF